jgi:hypothetical protein
MMRGGATSAASYGLEVAGSAGSQFSRTFDQSGPYGQIQGNRIILESGQNVMPASQMPTSSNLNLIQSAGGKSKHRRKNKRGGFGSIGEVIRQAIVPFGLLGLQNTYGKKKSAKNFTRRKRSF